MFLFRSALDVSRARRSAVLVAAFLGGTPLAAMAAPIHDSTNARSAATAGVNYGGVTSQEFPVIVEVNKKGRKVVRAVIAIRLTCTSGGIVIVPDSYSTLRIKKRKFSASFGPTTQRNPDGTTLDLEGAMDGAFSSSRTKVSGHWSFKGTEHDATGAITDTCDSGSVSWNARQ
jgi:hypothetical protein